MIILIKKLYLKNRAFSFKEGEIDFPLCDTFAKYSEDNVA